MSDTTQQNAISFFWSNPIEGLKALFAPANSLGADSLSAARVRAYGVDPSTGALIAPQYTAAAAAGGYNSSNPGAFIAAQENQVTNEFLADSAAFQMPLFPSFSSGIPGLSGSSGWLVLVVIAVLAFFLFKA